MKFKHTFHVFVDNFAIIYKHLLYGIIIAAIAVGLCCAVIIPAVNNIMSTEQYASLSDAIKALWTDVSNLNTELLHDDLSAFRSSFKSFLRMFGTEKAGLFALCAVLLVLIYLVYRFLLGIGNYTTGALINDKMTLQANSPFVGTMIKNLGKASIYNSIYVPVTFLYDAVSLTFTYVLLFRWLRFLPVLVKIFLLATVMIALTALKLSFTVKWLPSLIHGRLNNRKAIVNNFTQGSNGFASVFSNMFVLTLLILAINVMAVAFTFGAGLLLTVPASFVMLISFEFVTYYDTNGLKYFIGGGAIVGPKKENPPTVEEFFKGEE